MDQAQEKLEQTTERLTLAEAELARAQALLSQVTRERDRLAHRVVELTQYPVLADHVELGGFIEAEVQRRWRETGPRPYEDIAAAVLEHLGLIPLAREPAQTAEGRQL